MVVNIDLKDKKIIEALEDDARQSNIQIAKKVGLSKDAVRYRIARLEKEKIILGYYSVLNISRLGYLTYKLMINFQNTTSKVEEEIIKYLQKSKVVGWLTSCDGVYNLMVVFWVRKPSEFQKFLDDFLKKYSNYIKEREVLSITENHSCRKNYLFNRNKSFESAYYSLEQENVKFDSVDIKILHFLANNSRVPLYEIAESLNLTPEAISHRIKQLKNKDIVQAFRPILNTSFLGYEYYNVLFRLRNFDNIKQLFDYFERNKNIIYYVRYLGDFDVGIDIEAKDSRELRSMIKKIKDEFSKDIESYQTILVYQEHKLSYMPE